MDKPLIGIAGLGAMGIGIAQVFAASGFPVLGHDAMVGARETALSRLANPLDARVESGKLMSVERDAILSRVRIVDDLAGLAPCRLIIEAIVEKRDAKQTLFRTLEAVVSRDAVLATNTSSIPVGDIAAALGNPGRCLGLHFFNPAPVMRLVELIGHAGTSETSLALARDLTEAAGKTVIAAPDRPGFIVNRCARPFYGEALALLEEGRTPSDIDAAMQAAGYRLGPFSLIDLVGADINLAATEVLSAAMGGHPRYHVFARLKRQVAEGRLGRKSGAGFLVPDPVGPPPPDAPAIAARIEAALVNEAGWLLAEGGTTTDGIDTALKLGLNFPRGPFEILARTGKPAIRAELVRLDSSAPEHLRGRYQPAPLLAD